MEVKHSYDPIFPSVGRLVCWLVMISYRQGRAEDFRIPETLNFSARETSENFLSAPGKFLVTPLISYFYRVA